MVPRRIIPALINKLPDLCVEILVESFEQCHSIIHTGLVVLRLE